MRNSVALACVFALAGGCHPPTALEPPPPEPYGFPQPPEATGQFIDPRAGSVITSSHPLPPISGGTLGVTADGTQIVAADPDRDRIVIVDVGTGHLTTLELAAGSEPGRVAIDEQNHLAHVVLRGSGEIASVGIGGPATITRRTACTAPRGIAMDGAAGLVRVACRDGEIVSFDPTTHAAPVTMQTGIDDLRDIVVRSGDVVVTRFRSGEILRLDAQGAVVQRVTPISSVSPTSVRTDGQPAEFQPSVAWRAIPFGTDGLLVSHQRSSDGELVLAPGAYYDTGVCSGSIVQSAATVFQGETLTALASPNIAGVTLPVDIAQSPTTGEIAVIGAGIESTAFGPSVARIQPSALGVGALAGYDGSGGYGGGCINQFGFYGDTATQDGADFTPNAIAVAYLPNGDLVVQSREPSQIRIEHRTIALGGGSAFDTGHAFFHGDAGRGTACASCHPEGGDDGRTWSFADIGPRRTPAVPAGFLTTAPFHWSGDIPDLTHLMGTVFTERMGGPAVDAQHTAAVGNWLDTRPTDQPRIVDAQAAARGRGVFESAGCVTCHSGAMTTNNQTMDVGTGGAFQVPSLIGISRALPAMHTGCAHTLLERFDPACGGRAHGDILSETDPRVPDLIAYLNTL